MKIALITGGSRGIGKSAAITTAERGHDVIVTYLSNEKEALAVVAEVEKLGRKAVALQLDVSKVATFPDFVSRVKEALKSKWNTERIDFLVNNAGIGQYTSIMDYTEEDFDRIVNTHFKGVFFLTQKLLPIMNDGGRIINLSSGLARFSFPGSSVYGAAKAAVEVLTRYLAKELGERRITVNVVAPGPVQTDFGGGRIRNSPEMQKQLSSMTALGRVGAAEDIGKLIASMLSDETAWVNGQRIEASGGLLL